MNLGLAKFYDHAPRNKRGIKEKGKKKLFALILVVCHLLWWPLYTYTTAADLKRFRPAFNRTLLSPIRKALNCIQFKYGPTPIS